MLTRLWRVEAACVACAALMLNACGGGSDPGNAPNSQPAPTYTVGGTLSGLGTGRNLVLRNNGGDNLTLSANGSFSFPTALTSGSAYAVTVLTQPSDQTCTVSHGAGTVSAHVTTAAVRCESAVAPTARWYVRQGANGNGSGTDWTNAFPAFPATLERGATYYVASGTYAGRVFDTPASNQAYITIQGATAADHGTDVGWSSAYDVAGTPATWTGQVVFQSSHWVFAGNAGGNLSRSADDYGFRFAEMRYPVRVYNDSMPISDIVVSQVTATAPVGDIEKWFLWTGNLTQSVHRVTLRDSLLRGWGNAIHATSAGRAMSDWLVERNVILDGFSSALNHGEDINNNYGLLSITVRHNIFEGRTSGTAVIVSGLNGPSALYQIYGNVFKDVRGGDGIIAGVRYPMNAKIFNNTFINAQTPYNNGGWVAVDTGRTTYGPDTEIRNNIVCDSHAGTNSPSSVRSHNAYFNVTSQHGTNPPSETGRQTGATCPVINKQVGNFSLLGATEPGVILPSPFNSDASGAVRGADGVWDRGALEYR